MNRIRVVVIDDERSAREEVKRMLAGYEDFEVVGEAANADEAEALILRLCPQLIFLDIQMPGRSGFELLDSLDSVPLVIFTTAYDSHAIRAFEVNAMDYLMKPVRAERFEKAIALARQQHLGGSSSKAFIRDGKTIHLFAWNEVWLIESMDNYARIFYCDHHVLFKASLNQLEEKLAILQLFRANRAQLVNLDFLERAVTSISGIITLKMQNGHQIILSSRQSTKFRAMTRN